MLGDHPFSQRNKAAKKTIVGRGLGGEQNLAMGRGRQYRGIFIN